MKPWISNIPIVLGILDGVAFFHNDLIGVFVVSFVAIVWCVFLTGSYFLLKQDREFLDGEYREINRKFNQTWKDNADLIQKIKDLMKELGFSIQEQKNAYKLRNEAQDLADQRKVKINRLSNHISDLEQRILNLNEVLNGGKPKNISDKEEGTAIVAFVNQSKVPSLFQGEAPTFVSEVSKAVTPK